jgi:hypothetical protein
VVKLPGKFAEKLGFTRKASRVSDHRGRYRFAARHEQERSMRFHSLVN